MKAGDLRHQITLQKPTSATDARGNRVITYSDAASLWAGMKDVSGRDLYAALANNAEDLVTFTIRWRDDVRETYRVVYANQTYEIKQVNHLGYKRDFIQLKTRKLEEGA